LVIGEELTGGKSLFCGIIYRLGSAVKPLFPILPLFPTLDSNKEIERLWPTRFVDP